jgi:membrane associated rhomboid family serine protease
MISAGFLHGGFLHILLNGMMLLDLGRHCEPFLSSWKFLAAYVVCLAGGSAGSLIQSIATGVPGRSSVGASGALCGLIGLLLAHSFRERDREMRDGILRDVGGLVVLSLLFPGIDHAAHLGGFIAGGIFGLSVGPYISSREAARWRYPGYAAGAVGLGCLAWALVQYFQNR